MLAPSRVGAFPAASIVGSLTPGRAEPLVQQARSLRGVYEARSSAIQFGRSRSMTVAIAVRYDRARHLPNRP